MLTLRPNDIWVILGASSSIARALAHEIARHGSSLILAGRDIDDLELTAVDIKIRYAVSVEILSFDAAAKETHADFVKACGTLANGKTLNIALLFGDMPSQAEMDEDHGKIFSCIESTYTGAVSILHEFSPILEEQKAGRILAFGSVAGDRGRLKNYVYGSAKAGLHVYLAGLRNRLGRSNVSVTTIKPGFVDTAMTWGLDGLFLVASPENIAKASLKVALKGKNEIYYPFFWRGIMTIIKNIPECIFKKMKI